MFETRTDGSRYLKLDGYNADQVSLIIIIIEDTVNGAKNEYR
jgi:hypothetical protein